MTQLKRVHFLMKLNKMQLDTIVLAPMLMPQKHAVLTYLLHDLFINAVEMMMNEEIKREGMIRSLWALFDQSITSLQQQPMKNKVKISRETQSSCSFGI